MLPGNTQVAKEMLKISEKQEAKFALEVIADNWKKKFQKCCGCQFPGPAGLLL